MKKSYLTVTDQFCGAGGSSQGVRNLATKMGGGLEVHLAMNHWKLAIETHNTNFPDTHHDCADISNSDPRRYPSTDILITSPECTNHSLAKGKKRITGQTDMFDTSIWDESAERSRATMWDVPRFAEYHKYNIIIVENVVDARKWLLWDAWLTAMHALGYNHKCTYLNSMHFFPTPQSRDRMYIVFWKKGNKAPDLDYRPLAYSAAAGRDINAIQVWKNNEKRYGKYKTQYYYVCPETYTKVEPYYYSAFNCIDWSNLGTRIGDRKRPLSPNTIRRIKYGLDRFGNDPFQVVNYSPGYSRPLTDPVYTITTNDHHGLLSPFVVNDQHSSGIECRVRSVNDKLPSIPTMPHLKLITPPLIAKLEHASADNVISSMSPFNTQTTRQSMAMITPPAYIIEMNSSGKSKPIDRHTATFTAGGINHALLVNNKGKSNSKDICEALGCLTTKDHMGLMTTEAWNTFITYYYGNNQASGVTDPTGTITTNDRMALVSSQQPEIEDCYYRMLMPREIKLGMAFDKDYTVLGSGKDQVKQLGNAVTPPAMEWLVTQCVNSLN